MSAGQRRHLVQLLLPVETDDGEGGQLVTWDTERSLGPQLWGNILPVSAREQAISGALQSIVTFRSEFAYDLRITTTRRFRRIDPCGPDLQILGVRDPDGLKRRLEVDLSEVV